MLDHVTIGVTDAGRSKQFYDRALRPLGITRLYAEGEWAAGYGVRPKAVCHTARITCVNPSDRESNGPRPCPPQ